ncbi:MAG TPA: hypothetical protein VEY31_15535 [Roseococcus sp.]|nr:hypothetical protein [Roseococcus sp.]
MAAMATDPPRPQREARSHVRPAPPAATRAQAPHRATRTYSDGARLRDAPQELIPVLGPDMRGPQTHSSPRAACLQATRRAEHIHGVPDGLLTAVALAEPSQA